MSDDNKNSQNDSNNNTENRSNEKLKKLTGKLPAALQNVSNKVGTKYSNTANKAANQIVKGGKHFHVDIKRKVALRIFHGMVLGSLGLGGIGILSSNNQDQSLFSQNVCSTQNDNGTSYSDMQSDLSGNAGDWTQKGTKQYKMAKEMFLSAVKQGCSPAAAAGIVGQDGAIPANYQESPFNPLALQSGGGGGSGFFQFSNSLKPKSYSMDDQVECILGNGGRSPETGDSMFKNEYVKENNPMKAGQDFCIYFERPASAVGARADARGKGAVKAYQLFANLAPSVSQSMDAADQTSAIAEQANTANCAGQSDSGDDVGTSDSNIVNYAKKWLGKISYGANANRATGANAVANDSGTGTTDCSGFVWGVLKHLGYKVSSTPWTTSEMNAASGNLKEISPDQTQAGDIQVEPTGDAHTVILEEKYHGSDTKIIDEDGGSAASNVHESTFGWAYSGVPIGNQKFYRPIKK